MGKAITCAAAIAAAIVLASIAASAADAGVVAQQPELVVTRHGLGESLAMPGTGYHDFAADEHGASFVLEGKGLPAGSKRLHGGISQVRWEPIAGKQPATHVELSFARAPLSDVINAMPGTQLRPNVAQVIAAFSFPQLHTGAKPLGGSRAGYKAASPQSSYGEYGLPRLPEAHYSDALVTLNIHNADFRDVLWLMSEIGGVSIMLDPYWGDDPTGSRRKVGGGVDPNADPGGSGGPGFRPGGQFGGAGDIPEGAGRLTLNFENVPFDTALDMILQAVDLVKVDVYPGSM